MSAHVQVADRFAMIPEALLYDATLPAEAVRVYGVLLRYGSDPSNCYPSHSRIAEHIGKSARSVPAWIRALELSGWVDRVARWRNGDQVVSTRPDDLTGWEPTSNGYLVRAAQRGVRAEERVPLRAEEQGGSTLESAPIESQVNESHGEREPTRVDALLAAQFDEFWNAYPRKTAKAEARRAWGPAVKAAGGSGVIVSGAERYAADQNREPRFTAHAATWLRGERWNDDPLPARAATPANHRNVDQDRGRPGGRLAL